MNHKFEVIEKAIGPVIKFFMLLELIIAWVNNSFSKHLMTTSAMYSARMN